MSEIKLQNLIDRYESILEENQNKIWDLEEKLKRAESWANQKAWSRHRDAESLDLPVPRLQIELTIESDWCHVWFYSLVYKHTTGDIMAIPMGETTSKGGHGNFKFDSVKDAQFQLPFRDGVHIRRDAHHLNLPAYAIWKDKIFKLEEIVG